MVSYSYGRVNLSSTFKVKAVNLGGWLVTEGWIKPSLFDGIPNKDFLVCIMLNQLHFKQGSYLYSNDNIYETLINFSVIYVCVYQDGTALQFKSVTVGKYLCAELGGGTIIVANRTAASSWETFRVTCFYLL